MMRGVPRVGEAYHQEMAPGIAMDRAEIMAVDGELTVPAGRFTACVRTRESSALERGAEERCYAPGIGLIKDGDFLLIEVERPS